VGVELDELVAGDSADAWRAAGFAVDDDGTCRIGQVRVRLDGDGRYLRSWALRGLGDGVSDIDGFPTIATERAACEPAEHPNGVTSLDHVVLLSPDVDRTVAALAAVGVDARRTRDVDESQYGFPARQVFFTLGEPILELIGGHEPMGDGPVRMFGLAYTVRDIDALPGLYGEDLGRVKDAVQPGRRIATLRHKALGMSVATAFMSP
jgi:hypothetical protein